MILCDTNIFISAFNGRTDTIEQLNIIGLQNIVVSSITVMELYQGVGNKLELSQMKKKLKFYDVIQIDNTISEKAIELIYKFRLSHGLMIPDALIAATAVMYQIELYTYNVKDFDFIPNLKLYRS
jgi:predicted nucleic acid-binding protein